MLFFWSCVYLFCISISAYWNCNTAKQVALGKKRAARLRQLPQVIAGRMLRTNIMTKAFWDHTHSGLSGMTLQRQRSHLSSVRGIPKKHGDVEVAMALTYDPRQDPAYKLRIEDVQAWTKLYQATATRRQRLLCKAWCVTWGTLNSVAKPWLDVRGPLALAQTVFLEPGWSAPSFDCCVNAQQEQIQLDCFDPALQHSIAPRQLSNISGQRLARTNARKASMVKNLILSLRVAGANGL